MARDNLLTNGGLEIWQRGAGPFTANGAYAADRWISNIGAGSTFSVSKDTTNVDTGSGAAAAITYTHSVASELQQKMEDFAQFKGRTLSLSVRVRTSTANAVQVGIYDSVNAYRFGSFHTGDGTYQTLTVTAPVAATAINVVVVIHLATSCTAYIDNACLTVGSQPATYVPMQPADDLARCLRYYHKVKAAVRLNATGAQSNWTPVPYKTSMPVTPTFTLGTPDFVANLQAGSPSFAGATADGAIFTITSNATGDTYWAGPVVLEGNP